MSPETQFGESIELRAAKIVEITQHPEADKLYIETLDDGTEEGRTIVSGLVPHYAPEELLNRTIIVVANLKPAKLRGVKSNGMLLAASAPAPASAPTSASAPASAPASEGSGDDQPGEIVDVLFVDDLAPGTRLHLEGTPAEDPANSEHLKRLKIDDFFAVPMRAVGGEVRVGETRLMAGDAPVRTEKVADGPIG